MAVAVHLDKPSGWAYVRPIASGLLIALVGLLPFMVIARLNATIRPDLPWAAIGTVVYIGALLTWLSGVGPPKASQATRRDLSRLWRQSFGLTSAGGLPIVATVAILVGVYVAWIGISRLSPIPDLSVYPTTSYRWSMFLMGGLTAGVVEEVAYRGYMQRGLEAFDPSNALWMTSLVFVASHLVQGVEAVLVLGPGLFAASMLYGHLARQTGTILPGMFIHVLGDLAHTYFGVLHGQSSLLFVQ